MIFRKFVDVFLHSQKKLTFFVWNFFQQALHFSPQPIHKQGNYVTVSIYTEKCGSKSNQFFCKYKKLLKICHMSNFAENYKLPRHRIIILSFTSIPHHHNNNMIKTDLLKFSLHSTISTHIKHSSSSFLVFFIMTLAWANNKKTDNWIFDNKIRNAYTCIIYADVMMALLPILSLLLFFYCSSLNQTNYETERFSFFLIDENYMQWAYFCCWCVQLIKRLQYITRK